MLQRTAFVLSIFLDSVFFVFNKPLSAEVKEEKHGAKRKHKPSRRGEERSETEQLLIFDAGVYQ